jgi:hypothetical protein
MTPYEAWHGCKPTVHYLHKLDDRSSPAVFIGYEDGVKAYRHLDPITRRVCIARDIIFDEEHGWDWAADGGEYSGSNFDIEYISRHAIREPSQVSSSGENRSVSSRHRAQGASASAPPSALAASDATPTTPEFVTPLADDDDRLNDVQGDTPVRYCKVDNLFGGEEPVPGLAPRTSTPSYT